MTRDDLAPYLRCLADRMGLRDWTVTALRDPPDNPNHLATADCRYGRKIINVCVSDAFLRSDEVNQRETICHELLHAHEAPTRHLLIKALGDGAFEAYNLLMEYQVDALAEVIAPSMPLPSEVRRAKPRSSKMGVKKVGKGFENVSKAGKKFSKKPLTKADADAQLGAIEASKARAAGKKAGKK